MKKIYSLMMFFTTLAALAQSPLRSIDYSTSAVTFKIKNAGITVDGSFKDYTVNLQFDPKNLAATKVEGKIKTVSISTGINARDNHLKKEDFFQVDKYPEINFRSTVLKQQGTTYILMGKLTIKEVTKDVSIPLTITKTATTETFDGKLTINRLDFHVGEDSWVMSDEVMISIKITTK